MKTRKDRILCELGGMVISAICAEIEGIGELFPTYSERYLNLTDGLHKREKAKYAMQARRIGIMRGPRLFPAQVDLRVE